LLPPRITVTFTSLFLKFVFFAAIGQALQSGDLSGAQQAFAQLEGTFQKLLTQPPVYKPGANTASLISILNTTA